MASHSKKPMYWAVNYKPETKPKGVKKSVDTGSVFASEPLLWSSGLEYSILSTMFTGVLLVAGMASVGFLGFGIMTRRPRCSHPHTAAATVSSAVSSAKPTVA